ncbi:hypothetical protein LUZ60_005184 [Juncus effusus]|nr:hypothetical protein LUZ60_005184 [Juncus effusus]
MEGVLKQEEDRVKYETLIQAQDEISSLKTALSEKNSTLHHLISAHETLKTTSKEEIAKLESENRNLISALDEANLNKKERENKISAYQEEIQRLRSLLEESQKNIKQTEESAQKVKEVRKREELLLSFEEETEKLQEKLKWKCEQFSHLEEAHKKSQLELKEFKKETEKEKSEFVTKIAELETNLDSKSRFLEDFKSRLDMCKQALASEESKRKLLQAELREIQDRYNCVVTDFEAARLAVESVTQQRDADVASLRGILADKSLQIKEIEFEKMQVERENKELRDEVKEYREVQIGGVEKSKKFKALEKRIRVRDSEIEGLKRELDDCLMKLNEKGVDCLNIEGEIAHEECEGKIRVRDSEIEGLKRELDDCLVKLNDKGVNCLNLEGGIVHKECEGKIRVRDLEIENLKKDLDDCLVKLNERDGLIEKIRVHEVEIENLKRGLNDYDKFVEKIRVQKVEIEKLKRDLDDCLARLSDKDKSAEKLRSELETSYSKLEEDNVVKREELAVALLVIKGNYEGHFEKCVKNNHEILVESEKESILKKEIEDLICQVRERDEAIEGLKECLEREKALVRENESLLSELKERERVVEEIKECKAKDEALERENERLVFEVRERENIIKELKEREEALEREKERLIFVLKEREELTEELKLCLEKEKTEKVNLSSVVRERETVIKELEECKEREGTLERENDKLVSLVRERDGEIEELRESKAREEVLERENEKLVSLVRERETEIEEMKEERKRYTEIENEISKKLLEIKFKLDPLEGKYKEFSFELEENLYLLVEALGNSNSELELLQLKLHEMHSNYFLQEFEVQFKNCLISELEMELESKAERSENEKLENENWDIKYLNEIDGLKREKENLELQMLDLNCGIGSVFCADGEVKSILENISHKLKFEDDIPKTNSPLRNKAFIPVFGTRSPLKGKENNF